MSDLVLQTYLSLIQTSRSDSPNNRMGSALSRNLRITYQNTSSIRILDIYTVWTQASYTGSSIKKVEISLRMRLSGPQTLLATCGRVFFWLCEEGSSGRARKGFPAVCKRVFWSREEGSFGHVRKGLGNNLAQKYRAGMAQFLFPANFLFRSSTQLVRYYSNLQNFYVLVFIHFPSLVGWLAGVAFFPSSTSTAAFQCSRHFQERLFPRPFLVGQKGLGSRLYTLYVCTDITIVALFKGLPTVCFSAGSSRRK